MLVSFWMVLRIPLLDGSGSTVKRFRLKAALQPLVLQTLSSGIVQRSGSSRHFPFAQALGGRGSGGCRRLRLLCEIDCCDDGRGDARFVPVILRRRFDFLSFEKSADVACIN